MMRLWGEPPGLGPVRSGSRSAWVLPCRSRPGGRSTMRTPTVISKIRFAPLAAACLVALMGCEQSRTVVFYRPLPPKPRPLKPAPPDARANALVLNVSAAPLDTNGNGYPDLVHATAHLFDRRYPPAIYQDGEFVFAMFAPGDMSRRGVEPIREWRITDLEGARGRSAFGGCYRFRLSLLDDGGTDELNVPMADIVCVFQPADGGEPTWSGEVATIQVGQRVLVPQIKWRERGDSATDAGAWP